MPGFWVRKPGVTPMVLPCLPHLRLLINNACWFHINSETWVHILLPPSGSALSSWDTALLLQTPPHPHVSGHVVGSLLVSVLSVGLPPLGTCMTWTSSWAMSIPFCKDFCPQPNYRIMSAHYRLVFVLFFTFGPNLMPHPDLWALPPWELHTALRAHCNIPEHAHPQPGIIFSPCMCDELPLILEALLKCSNPVHTN